MKAFIASLLFLALLGIRAPASFAQTDQSYQKLAQEMETLKTELSAVQSQLQTVENVEKIELTAKLADAQAKLTDANAKLMNTEFGRFERNLRDSNRDWLRNTAFLFLAFISAVGITILTVVWNHFKSTIDSLIASEVGKRVNRFEESVNEVDVLKNQLKVLQAGHAVSVLEHFIRFHPDEESDYHKQIALIPEEALLQVFGDETRYMQLRLRAADVLSYRKSPLLVNPLLELMHSIADDSDHNYYDIGDWNHELIKPLGQIHTQASYQGLKQFLNRLLANDSVYKHLLLTSTVLTLAKVGVELNKSDSVSIVRKSIPDLEITSFQEDALKNLVEYFYKFNGTEGIKEILRHGLTDRMPDVEIRCLELLEKHDTEFVNDYRERKVSTNTETEAT